MTKNADESPKQIKEKIRSSLQEERTSGYPDRETEIHWSPYCARIEAPFTIFIKSFLPSFLKGFKAKIIEKYQVTASGTD
jgi:hypothetical protein